MYRPTMHLRTRNILVPYEHAPEVSGLVGIIEQMWVNDSQTHWKWVRVELVPTKSPIEGDGPPPFSGDQQKEPS